MSEIVCICGSTRFKEQMETVNKDQTIIGNIVLAPGVFGHQGDKITDEQRVSLDRLHCRKIDLSARIIVVSVDGYIGESTRNEIEYAAKSRKLITIVNFMSKAKESE